MIERKKSPSTDACGLKAPVSRTVDVDYDHRHFVNLVAAAFVLALAMLSAWAVKTIDEQESLRKCLLSGRKDCVRILVPPSGPVQPVR
jgi:hypothetical protein